MCNIDKLYDKIIRNSKEAEKQYLSIVTPKATAEKFKESPMTDEAFKEQLVRVLRNNVLDTDIRIIGDMAIGEKECSGLFLRTLSDETLLNECKARGLDVKYSEEENLAYRLNWVMQDYYKAGKDEEEREHRVKCYKLFWDALEDSSFFDEKEQKPVENPEKDNRYWFGFNEGKGAVLDSPEEYGLCKPVEWSEKDEKMKERLITRLNWITYNTRTDGTSPNITFFDEIEWLKSLPLNLKKKKEDVAKLCSND